MARISRGRNLRISDKDLGMSRILRDFKHLNGSFVKVGLQGSLGNKIHKESYKTVIDIGATHEFGDPESNIPERSFLRGTYDRHKKDWLKLNKALLLKLLTFKLSLTKSLDVMGLRLTSDIKKFIRKGIAPPNAPSTLARKASKGKSGRVIPLIDTGQMINSINYVKVEK